MSGGLRQLGRRSPAHTALLGDRFQIFEATQVVVERQKLNPELHALILQLGELDITPSRTGSSSSLAAG